MSVHKLTKYHNEFHSYITLADLTLGDLPEKLKFEGNELQIKSEFHISLVWGEKIAEMVDESRIDEIISEIISEFLKFNDKKPIVEYELLSEIRFLERGDQKTLIVMAKVKNLEEFFVLLRTKYQKNIPIQPTHITLYTLTLLPNNSTAPKPSFLSKIDQTLSRRNTCYALSGFDDFEQKSSILASQTYLATRLLPPDKTGVGIFDKKQLYEQTKVVDIPEIMDILFKENLG